MSGYKDTVVAARLDDEGLAQLDEIVSHLEDTKPDVSWNRSRAIRHMIERFHTNLK